MNCPKNCVNTDNREVCLYCDGKNMRRKKK